MYFVPLKYEYKYTLVLIDRILFILHEIFANANLKNRNIKAG